MIETTPLPAPRATLKERVERDRLARLAEPEPGTGSARLAALIAAAKEKAGR